MSEPTSTAETNPIDLPTGEPIPAAPSTTNSTSSSSSAPKKPTISSASLKTLLLALPTKSDAAIAHLQRCLATPSGTDTTLLFLCYTTRLTGALLQALSQVLLRHAPIALAILATPPSSSTTKPTTTTAVLVSTSPLRAAAAALAARLAARLKNLGALASEARTIARLWALLGMYSWAKRLILSPTKANSTAADRAATLVSWAQLIACTAFQYLENGAYLSGRGVLGWTPREQGRAYVVGSRWLAAYTGLEIGRLLADIVVANKKPALEEKNKSEEESVKQEEESRAHMEAVRRSMAINLAWTPLTLHWATEGGFLTDLAVGLGGCIPGVLQMRKLWKETAL